MRWLTEKKIESNFRALGISLSAEKVLLDDVDLDEGLRKQARLLGKLNEEYVLQLAVAMEQPEAAFPMTVLQKPPRGKLYPISGNHRLASFTTAFPQERVIEAYVVQLKDPKLIDILPRIVNAWESGLGFSKEEKIINARWLVDHHSLTQEEAARLVSIPLKWLYAAARAEDVRDELVGMGVQANGFSRHVLGLMAPLNNNTNVLRSCARLLTEHGIKGKEAELLIADVKGARTELQQLAELGRWEKMMAERAKAKENKKAKIKFSHAIRDAVIRHLTGLAKLLGKHKTMEQLQLTDPADKDVVVKNWIMVLKAMNELNRAQGGAG